MKRVEFPRKRPESTLSEDLRQKVDILCCRGAPNFSRFWVRELPRLKQRGPRGLLSVGSRTLQCAIGVRGIGVKRREGDSITPIGRFKIIFWLTRPGNLDDSRVGSRFISHQVGWCDDPRSFSYNKLVKLPSSFKTESLWRDDRLYDLVGVLDFNTRPRVRGKGSAIFLHCAHPDYSPTAGCVALQRSALFKLKKLLRPRPYLTVGDARLNLRRRTGLATPRKALWRDLYNIAFRRKRSLIWEVFSDLD